MQIRASKLRRGCRRYCDNGHQLSVRAQDGRECVPDIMKQGLDNKIMSMLRTSTTTGGREHKSAGNIFGVIWARRTKCERNDSSERKSIELV